jgi:hypothetical protein
MKSIGLKLTLLVVRAFEVVEVLEGDLLEDGVDGLRVEALANDLQQLLKELRDLSRDLSDFSFTNGNLIIIHDNDLSRKIF